MPRYPVVLGLPVACGLGATIWAAGTIPYPGILRDKRVDPIKALITSVVRPTCSPFLLLAHTRIYTRIAATVSAIPPRFNVSTDNDANSLSPSYFSPNSVTFRTCKFFFPYLSPCFLREYRSVTFFFLNFNLKKIYLH